MDANIPALHLAAEIARRRSAVAYRLARSLQRTGPKPDIDDLARAVIALADAVSALILAPLPSHEDAD